MKHLKIPELTPAELYALSYDPFGTGSPLLWQQNLDAKVLKDCPFFQLLLLLLTVIEEKGAIRLTGNGYLPLEVCRQLYEARLFYDWNVEEWLKGKVGKEKDWLHLNILHTVLQMSTLVEKRNNRLLLTPYGAELLPDPENLFREFLRIYTMEFDWSLADGFPKQIGQYGFGLGIFLLLHFGHSPKPPVFYGKLYMETFPALLEQTGEMGHSKAEEQALRSFEWRFFHHFTELFGFTASSGKSGLHDRLASVQQTPLLQAVFGIRSEK